MGIDFSTLIRGVNTGIAGGLAGKRLGDEDRQIARSQAIQDQLIKTQTAETRRRGEALRLRQEREDAAQAEAARGIGAQIDVISNRLGPQVVSGLAGIEKLLPKDQLALLQRTESGLQSQQAGAAERAQELEDDAADRAHDITLKGTPGATRGDPAADRQKRIRERAQQFMRDEGLAFSQAFRKATDEAQMEEHFTSSGLDRDDFEMVEREAQGIVNGTVFGGNLAQDLNQESGGPELLQIILRRVREIRAQQNQVGQQ